MLILQNISNLHPNKDLLFGNINLTVNNHEKIVLIGNNGIGKSTLLKIIAKEAINEYQGTLIVVSHDEYFLKQTNIERVIAL